MKSTTTIGSINFDPPTITQTDRFVCATATQLGVLTYQTTDKP